MNGSDMNGGAYSLTFGVAAPHVDRFRMLGTQPGSVGLNAAGALSADFATKKVGVVWMWPRSTVRVEWDGRSMLSWLVNDKLVCTWRGDPRDSNPPDMRGWNFAVGGFGEGELIEIGLAGRHIPPPRESLAECMAAADEELSLEASLE